jgi:hypothetical protein
MGLIPIDPAEAGLLSSPFPGHHARRSAAQPASQRGGFPLIRSLTNRPWQAGLAAIAALTLATAANADIHGGALVITATAANGDQATFVVEPPADARSWTWSSHDRIEMRSPTSGNLIATINPNGDETLIQYIDDPVVTLAYAVQAGPSTTSFMISSGLLSFPTIGAAEGRATAGASASDSDGDGVTFTGGNLTGGSYIAQYNGFAGTLSGTTFAELLPGLSAGAFDTDTDNASVPLAGFQAIPGAVNDMSVRVDFSLTANDQASGTSTYVIQQKPTPVENATWSGIKSLLH